MSHDEFMKACYKEARDNNRTPMQWDNSVNAGFNKGHQTWMKVNPNYVKINAQNEQNDKNSILNYYKQLLNLRKSEEYQEVITYGDFNTYLDNYDDIFIYTRENNDKHLCVVTNMSKNTYSIKLPFGIKKVLLHNYSNTLNDINVELKPYETLVYEF